jgi:peptidoglycan/xylan/chitin deacetylase (PgdA/CDA1 family)
MQVSISPGMWLPVLRSQPPGDMSVAITIDDAPMPDSLPGMLDSLDEFGAKATFFMSGCRIVHAEELVQETVRRGHAVYAHGWDHVRLDKEKPDRLIVDFDRCENILAKYRPTPQPYLVRMPYNGGYRKISVHRSVRKWMPNSQIAHWRLSTEDHLISPRCSSAGDIEGLCRAEARRVVSSPRIHGAIILMHDQPINDRKNGDLKAMVTVTLLKELLTELHASGLVADVLHPHPSQRLMDRFVLF